MADTPTGMFNRDSSGAVDYNDPVDDYSLLDKTYNVLFKITYDNNEQRYCIEPVDEDTSGVVTSEKSTLPMIYYQLSE